MKTYYTVKQFPPGVIKNDMPVIVETVVHGNSEMIGDIDINVLPLIIPFGADKDPNFRKNIKSAKSKQEVEKLVEGWVNV